MTTRVGVAFAAVCLLASSTHAQSKNAQAETLFRQARELMAQKKYAEACAAFESSQKLDPAAGTQFSVGVCNELEGKLATAWGVFIDFERAYRGTTDPVAKELLPKAHDRAAKLEPRLSKLTIVIAKPTVGLALTLDGQDIDAGTWSHGLPIDGGEHVIVARLAKHEDATQKVTVAPEKDSQTVTIGELVLIADAPTPPVPVAEPHPVPQPLPPKKQRSLVAPIAVATSAVILGGAALGLELWGRSMHDDAQSTLDDGNDSRANDLQDGANVRRHMAQGLGIGAIACAGVSIYLFVRGGSHEPTDRTTLRLVPTASSDRAGLAIGGAW